MCFREAIPASWYLYHSLDLKLLYTTTPGHLCEITSFLTNRRGSGLAINLPEEKMDAGLEEQKGFSLLPKKGNLELV